MSRMACLGDSGWVGGFGKFSAQSRVLFPPSPTMRVVLDCRVGWHRSPLMLRVGPRFCLDGGDKLCQGSAADRPVQVAEWQIKTEHNAN